MNPSSHIALLLFGKLANQKSIQSDGLCSPTLSHLRGQASMWKRLLCLFLFVGDIRLLVRRPLRSDPVSLTKSVNTVGSGDHLTQQLLF